MTARLLFALALVAVTAACPQKPAPSADAGAALGDAGAVEDLDEQMLGAHGAPSKSKIGQLAPDAVILVVDGVKFTKKQLDQAITQSALVAGVPPQMLDGAGREAFEKPAYEKLVERQLLAQEAKKRGLFPTLEEAEAATKEDRERLMKTLPPGKTFNDALARVGTDEATFRAELQTDVAVQRLFKAVDTGVKQPPDADLKKFYDANIERMQVKPTASASHILVKVARDAPDADVKAALEKARQLRAQAKGKDKAAFGKLAVEKSEDPMAAQTQGDLGTFAQGDLLPEIEAAAFKLKAGEVSEPVRTDRGFHVVLGGGTAPGKQRTFDEVKGAIAQRERTKLLLQAVDDLVEGLRKAAKIERLVEPAPSPFGDADGHGSQVPAWPPLPNTPGGPRPPGHPSPTMPPGHPPAPPVTIPPGGTAG